MCIAVTGESMVDNNDRVVVGSMNHKLCVRSAGPAEYLKTQAS